MAWSRSSKLVLLLKGQSCLQLPSLLSLLLFWLNELDPRVGLEVNLRWDLPCGWASAIGRRGSSEGSAGALPLPAWHWACSSLSWARPETTQLWLLSGADDGVWSLVLCWRCTEWGTACFGVPPVPASQSHTTSPAVTTPSPSGQRCSCWGTARGERVLVKWTNGVFYVSLLVFALFEIQVLVIILPVPQSCPLTATSHPKGKGLREGKCKGLTGKISWSPQCTAMRVWGSSLRVPVEHFSKWYAS